MGRGAPEQLESNGENYRRHHESLERSFRMAVVLARTEWQETNARAWGDLRDLGWSSNKQRLEWLRKRNPNWSRQDDEEDEVRLLEEEVKDEQELANWQSWKETLDEWDAAPAARGVQTRGDHRLRRARRRGGRYYQLLSRVSSPRPPAQVRQHLCISIRLRARPSVKL